MMWSSRVTHFLLYGNHCRPKSEGRQMNSNNLREIARIASGEKNGKISDR